VRIDDQLHPRFAEAAAIEEASVGVGSEHRVRSGPPLSADRKRLSCRQVVSHGMRERIVLRGYLKSQLAAGRQGGGQSFDEMLVVVRPVQGGVRKDQVPLRRRRLRDERFDRACLEPQSGRQAVPVVPASMFSDRSIPTVSRAASCSWSRRVSVPAPHPRSTTCIPGAGRTRDRRIEERLLPLALKFVVLAWDPRYRSPPAPVGADPRVGPRRTRGSTSMRHRRSLSQTAGDRAAHRRRGRH